MFLAFEVDVNRPFGYAGAFGDLVECGHGVTGARKLGEGGFQDLVRALILLNAVYALGRISD